MAEARADVVVDVSNRPFVYPRIANDRVTT
jgi:imidazoleglycerol phosphate dehydratase HisB